MEITQPMAISLPASAKPILDSLEKTGADLDRWTCGRLPKITNELKEAARSCLIRIEKRFEPTEEQQLRERIFIFLGHFYIENKPDAVFAAEARDWVLSLQDLPFWAIDQGCVDYLRKAKKKSKPLPGMVREMALKAMGKDTVLKIQCEKILKEPVENERPQLSEEGKAEAKKRVSAMLKDIKKVG